MMSFSARTIMQYKEEWMARIVVIGAGAAGTSAASSAKQYDPSNDVTLIGDFSITAYSPCGIPYVFGRVIESMDKLILQGPEFYTETIGLNLQLSTTVERIDKDRRVVVAKDGREFPYDKLVIATGWSYVLPKIPGVELDGVQFIKNIERAKEIDQQLDSVKNVIVWKGRPVGLELATGLANRKLDVTLIDDEPWLQAEFADPEVMKLGQDSLEHMGVKFMMSTELKELRGKDGKLVAAVTDRGEVPCEMAFMAADEKPNTALAESIGVKLGSGHGIIVDDMMRTNVPDVYAAGAVVETMQAGAGVPVPILPSTYAYPQGRIAGVNAAGGSMHSRAVYFPWALEVGHVQIGGVLITELLAKALGKSYVVGEAKGITCARYHPAVEPMNVKMLVDPKSRELIGIQFYGGEGVKERADFMAFAMRKHATVDELANMENVYSPPIGALNEPICVAAKDALKKLSH
jgi:NADH oxidase (H2O2-forming)